MTSVAILVVRAVAGLTLAAHGAQKAFGAFGGPGMQGWTASVDRLRLWPVPLWAWVAALSELAGGLLLALGLLTPIAAAACTGAMLMAILAVHWPKGFFAARGGFEFPMTLLAIVVAVALAGPGRYSLDSLLGLALPQPASGIVALVAGAVGVLLSFGSRLLRGRSTTELA